MYTIPHAGHLWPMMRPFASSSAKCTLSGDGSGSAYSTVVKCDMNWTGSAMRSTVRRFEARDVLDVALRLSRPADADARPGLRALGRAAIEGVEQRGVGAVQLHERPRERPVERMRAQRLGHPGRVLHDALRADVDHLRQRLAGRGVVLD